MKAIDPLDLPDKTVLVKKKNEKGRIKGALDIVKDSYSFKSMTRDVSTAGISLLYDEITKILR